MSGEAEAEGEAEAGQERADNARRGEGSPGRLHRGYALSPATVHISLVGVSSPLDRRLVLFGASGDAMRAAQLDAARLAALRAGGVDVHVASTGIYLAAGLLLWGFNGWRAGALRRRRRRPAMPGPLAGSTVDPG